MRDVGVLWGAIYPGKTKLARERSYNISYLKLVVDSERQRLCAVRTSGGMKLSFNGILAKRAGRASVKSRSLCRTVKTRSWDG